MHEQLKKLQAETVPPLSAVDIIRKSLDEMIARKENPDQPVLLSGEQLKYFDQYKDCLPAFLASENGKDAIYVLCDAFKAYVTAELAAADPAP